MKITQIDEDSWVLTTDVKNVLLLSKQIDEYILTGNNVKISFDSMEEVSAYFNVSDIFSGIRENKIEETDHDFYIRGFYIDCKKPVEVYATTNGIPLYKKHKYTNIEYAAGYYAVRRSDRWSYIRCPKFSTLVNHDFFGPFKSKRDAQNRVKGK